MVDNTNPLSFIFNGSDPNVNSQLRQRIALAMLTKQKRYPKTFGEGLSAIGEALGDIGTTRRLEQQDLSDQASAKSLLSGGTPAGVGTNTVSEAPPPTQTAYAPPADVPAASPPSQEPAAPNALAQLPSAAAQPLTTTPAAEQPPSTMFNPTPTPTVNASVPPPAGQFSPRDRIAKTLAPADGGYNLIDAQAGMKRQGQGRVQDAVEAAFPGNPDMQAYGSQLAAGEQARPGEVSSTGARGPWQFVPGTAKQYGLNNPDDPMAAAEALKAFTADNASTFIAKNGRAPTMAELAVMHQQGGTTGANMVAGTGNASPRNLALNNVPPGASPAAAVDKIKGYYGLPDRAVDASGGGAREAIAQALAPKPQVMAFDGQPTPSPQQQIQQAPPQRPIAQAPARTANTTPADTPGYVMPQRSLPVAPTPTPMTAREAELTKIITDNPNNPYVAQRAAPELTRLKSVREAADARNIEQFKDAMTHERARDLEREKQLGDQTKRRDENEAHRIAMRKAADEESVRRQFANMDPNKVFDEMVKSKDGASKARDGLIAANNARKAINDGAIVGFGAETRMDIAKIATAMGLTDKGRQITNTETFRAAMAPVIAATMAATVGSQNISNSDREFAAAAAGGSIKLEGDSIRRIIDIVGRASREALNSHDTKVRTLYGDQPQGRALFGVEAPPVEQNDPLLPKETAEKHRQAQEWLKANPDDPRAPAVRKKLGFQ
jgi:hypothetical protein